VVVAAPLLLGIAGRPADAQGVGSEAPVETEERLRSLERAGEAGEASALELPAGRVDYADVLANPDDLALNLAYAGQQIAEGNLKGASATLQRILLLVPEAAPVRALYGIVLFRLGDLAGAESALAGALEGGLDATATAQAQRYLELARAGQQRTTGELAVSLGMAYDSNRNAAPEGQRQLFRDLQLTGPKREADTAILAIVQGSVEHDLGLQGNHNLYGNAFVYAQEQRAADEYDLGVYSVDGGVGLDFGRLELRPGLRGAYYRLDGESYLRTGGAQLEGILRIRPDLRLTLDGYSQLEDFRKTDAAPEAEERDGWRHEGRLALAWNTQDVAFSFGAVVTRKTAREDYEAYVGFGPEVTATLLLGAGQFVLGEFGVELRRYDQADRFVSATRRSDDILRLGLTYGLPLGTLFGEGTPEFFAPVNLLIALEATRHDSNLDNYDYTNGHARVLLSRRFRF